MRLKTNHETTTQKGTLYFPDSIIVLHRYVRIHSIYNFYTMTKEEFLDHYDNDNQRFRDALDELLKEHTIKFIQHHYKEAGSEITDSFGETLYLEWINQTTER